MPRDRHQDGWVELTGKKEKKWRGHYYVYTRLPDGTEKRNHKAVILAKKSEMRKWEAENKLKGVVAKETSGTHFAASPEFTLRWFWENRFKPLKEPHWKPSSRPKTVRFIERYVLNRNLPDGSGTLLGDVALGNLSRFTIQQVVNELGERYSRSVVQKFRVYIHAILDEALEQDFIGRNPARKIDLPQTRPLSKRILSNDEIAALVAALEGRDRLIIRMFLVLGLRPGELFALRRNDRIEPSQLRIDESVSEELHGGDRVVAPKTKASIAYVWLPKSIQMELDWWLDNMKDQRPEAFIFASANGTPLNLNNFLNRVIKPAAERARKKVVEKGGQIAAGFLEGLNHQVFRRTCATYMQKVGTVKDVQTHLRHSTPAMTVGVYMQQIPASVRAAVESLDESLKPAPATQRGPAN